MRGRKPLPATSVLGQVIQDRRRAQGLSRRALRLPRWVERGEPVQCRRWVVGSTVAGAVLARIGLTRRELIPLLIGTATTLEEARRLAPKNSRARSRRPTALEAQQLRMATTRRSDELPDDRLELVEWAWRKGHPWPVIARAFGYPLPSAKNRRAIKNLRSCTRKRISRLREKLGEDRFPLRRVDLERSTRKERAFDKAAEFMRASGGRLPDWALSRARATGQ